MVISSSDVSKGLVSLTPYGLCHKEHQMTWNIGPKKCCVAILLDLLSEPKGNMFGNMPGNISKDLSKDMSGHMSLHIGKDC